MAMVFVPGFMLDADLWHDLGNALAAWGPVIHADTTEGDTLEEMAGHILAAAPPAFVLLGFSMGGYVAREIVRQAPGRVQALILAATSARGDTDLQAKRKAAMTDERGTTSFRSLSAAAIASSLHPDNAGRTDLISRIRDMSHRLGAEVFHRQSRLVRRDGRAELGSIRS